MSLFGSIQLASNALRAAEIGLQVTGNNIANANTPGYIREEVVFTPAPTHKQGELLFGLGVDVTAIVQKSDKFLQDRLRGAISDLHSGETRENAYLQLEALISELSDSDISTSLNNFFGSIQEILNQPESVPTRNLAVLSGKTVTDDLRRLSSLVQRERTSLNQRVETLGNDINRLARDIAQLNVDITNVEGGSVSKSDAVGLRDQRQRALDELASIINIRAVEQPNGEVNVLLGGDFLVSQGEHRTVEAFAESAGGFSGVHLRVDETDRVLDVSSGELGGVLAARDEILGGFSQKLDDFAAGLIFEFNRVFAGGQGLKGHDALTSEFAVGQPDAALDQLDLPFVPENGSLQVKALNKETGLTETTDLLVRLNGEDDDTTVADFVSALDGIDGISARITPQQHVEITSDSPNVEFAFADDTSGVLAALGLGTFFTGSSAADINIEEKIADNPAKFAASGGGIGADTEVAKKLAALMEQPLDSLGGDSLSFRYERIIGETTQASAVAGSVAEGFRVFHQTLEGQTLAVSGVSIDEEAVKMLSFQRMYQATARYISTINELLDVLVSL